MGIRRSKPWVPDKFFVSNCTKQGFVAISPPVYLSKKEIHTIDLGFDNAIYYVQRWKNDLSVKLACSATLTIMRDEIVVVYTERGVIVLKGISALDNGNLYVTFVDGNYVVKKEDYLLANMPVFVRTGNQEYDRLCFLFEAGNPYDGLTPKN